MKSPDDSIRVYRDRLGSTAIRAFWLLAAFLALVVAAAPPLPAIARVPLVALLLCSLLIAYRAGRMGVAVTPSGVWLGMVAFSRWIPWREVSAFEERPFMLYAEVRVRVTDGRSYRTMLVQGRAMRWHGGKTRDVLSALNADLQAARARRLV
jgi:hypothetical protein